MNLISVAIPAFNEETNLERMVRSLLALHQPGIELIIVNDGSCDGTAEVGARLEREHGCIRFISHSENRGIGRCVLSALSVATQERFIMLPADGIVSTETVRKLFSHAMAADLVAAHPVNPNYRGYARRFLSWAYSTLYRATFRIQLRHIHPTAVYSTEKLRALELYSNRYGLFAEINVKLLRSGASLLEMDGTMNIAQNKSSAIHLKNLVDAMKTYFLLLRTA